MWFHFCDVIHRHCSFGGNCPGPVLIQGFNQFLKQTYFMPDPCKSLEYVLAHKPSSMGVMGEPHVWKSCVVANPLESQEICGLPDTPTYPFLWIARPTSMTCHPCKHTSNLSRIPRVYPCKFFLAGVNFYRFNAKNWHFQQILREKVAFFLQI